MTRFEDHFSRLAGSYVQRRPRYPAALFSWLAGLAPTHELAWDCGTGNGQAALELAQRFARVHATDASPEQIAHATPHARIRYRVEPAEQVSLGAASVDLVTVAAAAHWFDLDRFYDEVRRVLKPGGVLALWTYHLPVIEPAVDRILRSYHDDVVGRDWPERFHYVPEHYRTLPFPFTEIAAPPFEVTATWDLDELAGFIDTWSASQRYAEREGRHPLNEVWQDLVHAWGGATRKREVRWPIYLRAGRQPVRGHPEGHEADVPRPWMSR